MTTLTAYRFAKEDLTLKPAKVVGERALCLVYADTRAYQDALDSSGVQWATTIQPVNDKTVIVALTIDGLTRSASGEDSDFMSSEARAFKRACSAFGLGRYLYAIDLGFQPYDGKKFAQAAYTALDKGLAALDTTPPVVIASEPWGAWSTPDDLYAWGISSGALRCEQHGRNALKQVVDQDLGGRLTKTNWTQACQLFFNQRQRRQLEKAAA
jgi:hypothetical protein